MSLSPVLKVLAAISIIAISFYSLHHEQSTDAPFLTSSSSGNSENILYRNADGATRADIDEVQNYVRQKGCATNTCFVIDGSKSISRKDFGIELSFVQLFVNLTSKMGNMKYCAVQYSDTTMAISPLTDDGETFLRRLSSTTQVGGKSNLAAGVGYGVVQLFPCSKEPTAIIVLGNGRSDIGFDSTSVTKSFLNSNGSIYAVGVGRSRTEQLEKVTGSPKRVFRATSFKDVVTTIRILVKQVCNA